MNDPRMVKLAELWERTSAKGTRYFSGFMGGCQVLMFDGGEQPHPTKPDETVHVWRLMVQERDPARRPERQPQSPAKKAPIGALRRDDAAKPSARQQPEGVAQRSPARHQGQGDGWRGSQYRRPVSGTRRAPAAGGEAIVEDGVDDLYR